MNPQETRASRGTRSSPSATRASPSSSSSTTCASSSTSATASPCLVQGEKLVEGTPTSRPDRRARHRRLPRHRRRGRRGAAEVERELDEPTAVPPSIRRRKRTTDYPHDTRGPPRAKEAASDRHCSRSRTCSVAYGKIEAVKGISFTVDEPARSSPSSAPTAPARPPPCAPSPGCSGPVGGQHQLRRQADQRHPPPTRSSRSASPTPPRAGTSSPGSPIEENLAARRLPPQGQGRHRAATSHARLRPLPHPRGTPQAGRPARSPAASSRCSPWAAP